MKTLLSVGMGKELACDSENGLLKAVAALAGLDQVLCYRDCLTVQLRFCCGSFRRKGKQLRCVENVLFIFILPGGGEGSLGESQVKE